MSKQGMTIPVVDLRLALTPYDYQKLHVVNHPLVQHKMSILRDKDTGPKEFRELTEELAMLLAYEATRKFGLDSKSVKTPLETTDGFILSNQVAIVPILRAGLGMVEGILKLIPTAKVGHIGVYRDHDTLNPVDYYCKFPEDLAARDILLLDPMLATGGSARAAIKFLKQHGALPERIKFMCLLAAPEGVKAVRQVEPDVEIYTAQLDRCLNESGYIMPGLGDAGDRLFGTK